MISKDLINVVLEDDNSETGGVSFRGETLRDFLEYEDGDTLPTIEEVNNDLIACGIKPL